MLTPDPVRPSRWRWVRRGLGAVAGLVALALLTIWVLSERVLRADFDFPPLTEVELPSGDSVVAEGRRLATLRGCVGCHGEGLSGQMFVDEFLLARVPAPNLSTILPTYSNEELAHTLRHGISRDGRRMIIMPSSMYYHLSDADLGMIIAWLRTVSPIPNDLGSRRIGLLGRLGLALGEFQVEPALIDHHAPRLSADTTDPLARGEYLARTICTECHGPALEGDGEFSPHLGIVAGYTETQFEHLMQTGEPIGGRELELMGEVARGRFVHLTGPERLALYAYLQTLVAPPAPSAP